jgi:hypothetical protein
MNECLTIDDEDEEDHRWFFPCRNPDMGSTKRIPVNRDEFFLLKFYSGIRFLEHMMKKQVIPAITQKPDFRGPVSG